jgi:hypothetical protein
MTIPREETKIVVKSCSGFGADVTEGKLELGGEVRKSSG